jgi:hypothetical protein
MPSPRILALGALLLACGLAAGAELPTQRVSFFAFHAPSFPAIIHVQTGTDQFAEVKLVGANTTDSISVVNATGAIRIYGKPVTNEEGGLKYPVLGIIKANSDWKRVFAVLIGDSEGAPTNFHGRSFEISDDRFPEGSIQFVNLSDCAVRGKLGKYIVGLRPGQIDNIKFSDRVGALVDVVFQYQRPNTDNWSRMIATRWAVPDRGRRLMFAFQDPKTGRMSSKTLPLRD